MILEFGPKGSRLDKLFYCRTRLEEHDAGLWCPLAFTLKRRKMVHYCCEETNELGLPTCCHTPKSTVHEKKTAWRPSSHGCTISLASFLEYNFLPPLLFSMRLAMKHMEHQGVQTPKLCHSLLLALRCSTASMVIVDDAQVLHPNGLEFGITCSTKGEPCLPVWQACSPNQTECRPSNFVHLGWLLDTACKRKYVHCVASASVCFSLHGNEENLRATSPRGTAFCLSQRGHKMPIVATMMNSHLQFSGNAFCKARRQGISVPAPKHKISQTNESCWDPKQGSIATQKEFD